MGYKQEGTSADNLREKMNSGATFTVLPRTCVVGYTKDRTGINNL